MRQQILSSSKTDPFVYFVYVYLSQVACKMEKIQQAYTALFVCLASRGAFLWMIWLPTLALGPSDHSVIRVW